MRYILTVKDKTKIEDIKKFAKKEFLNDMLILKECILKTGLNRTKSLYNYTEEEKLKIIEDVRESCVKEIKENQKRRIKSELLAKEKRVK